MDKIRIKKSNGAFNIPLTTDDYIYITGENILVERYEEGDWYDLVRIDKTPSEKRWDKMVEKRKILKLVESCGWKTPPGFSTSLVYDIVVEGIKAEKEYEEETGKKWDWDEYDREREKRVQEIIDKILRGREKVEKYRDRENGEI